jgi:hypothetical protein
VHVPVRPRINKNVLSFYSPLSDDVRAIAVEHHDDLAIFMVPVLLNKLQAIAQPVQLFQATLDKYIASHSAKAD